MKIIKEGALGAANRAIEFICTNCGCVFQAEKNEYRGASYIEMMCDHVDFKCTCPHCACTVYHYDASSC